jgi:Mg-chelatase subunit ChlD
MSDLGAVFAPLQANTRKPVELAMQRLWLTGRVLPAGARLFVQHVFRSQEDRPVEVIYPFMLPRDSALRSFRITGEGFDVHSELMPREEAASKYEAGIAAGSLSSLARVYSDGVVNLTVGNLQPGETVEVLLEVLAGVELRDDGFRFRFPFSLAPTYHARMRAAEVDGEAEMELPADEFGDVILPRYRKDGASLHEVGFDLAISSGLAIGEVGSPSHSIRVGQNGARVALARGKDVPNRDLVLDVRFSETAPQALAGPNEDGKRRFAAIIPSTVFGSAGSAPRRTVILLDRSGSMQGEPLAQGRNAIEACLATLTNEDQFGIVAFDNTAETLHPSLLPGTSENRGNAHAFLSRIEARGGTELAAGVDSAARMLTGGGEIMIVTDGQVSGTEQILERARSTGLRLFCLGIGSASQDRFLSLLARETGGISRFVTPRERVDMAAVDLFASIGRPVASDLKIDTAVEPRLPASVFFGTPVLAFGEIEADRPDLELTWHGGQTRIPVPAGDAETGATVRLLQGSRLITDFESRYPGGPGSALDKRQDHRVSARLAELSRTFGLASREMSLVAVVRRKADRPGELPETRVVTVGMPQGVNFGEYFGDATCLNPMLPSAPAPTRIMRAAEHMDSFLGSVNALPPQRGEVELMGLAARLEADGGLPGKNISQRAARSAAALLAFAAAGHTPREGAFRVHVQRLIGFLELVTGLSQQDTELLNAVIRIALSGASMEGDWVAHASGRWGVWRALRKAMAVHKPPAHK